MSDQCLLYCDFSASQLATKHIWHKICIANYKLAHMSGSEKNNLLMKQSFINMMRDGKVATFMDMREAFDQVDHDTLNACAKAALLKETTHQSFLIYDNYFANQSCHRITWNHGSCLVGPHEIGISRRTIMHDRAYAELSTGRMDPRVGSGRVGSGRVGSGRVGPGRVTIVPDFRGSGRVSASDF